MPASEAQVAANQANSLRSTGPRTAFGREQSRANSLKHGLTGAGVVLPSEDAAEVERMARALEADFRPSDETGRLLIRRAAVCAVRMERGVAQETAALTERVLKAQAQAEADGEDPIEAGHRAMFDPSKEACLARRYEAASERGYYRALKEFRHRQREASSPSPTVSAARSEAQAIRKQMAELASFFPAADEPPAVPKPTVATPAPAPKRPSLPPKKSTRTVFPAWNPVFKGSVDVPITIGKAR